jgi:primary-amine oxidase
MRQSLTLYTQNPALDVPPSEQSFNKSTLVSEQHHQPTVEAVVGQGGVGCGHKL